MKKRCIYGTLGVISLTLGLLHAMNSSKGPQFKVTQKEGRGYVEIVHPGDAPSGESTPPSWLKPEDVAKWRSDIAASERLRRKALEQKQKRKEERWYTLTSGTLKVKISGGSGKYRYILSKNKGSMLSDETEDTIQDGNPIFKNVSAGYHTVRVIDKVTNCEASSDFTITRETNDISVAQFKPLPDRC